MEHNKEKHENKVFYVTDERQQAQYIKLFKEQGMEAVILSTMIDSHFIQYLEMEEKDVKFLRIDSDISDSLKNTDEDKDDAAVKELTESLEKVFKGSLNNEKLKVQVEALKSESVPAMILLSEQSRRMQEMARNYGGFNFGGMYDNDETLVLNRNNSLIRSLMSIKEKEDRKEDVQLICEHVYDLALMSHKQLEPDAMTKFIDRSNTILSRLAAEDAK
ncbi:MAG: heat shock protein 90 [Firmicutes bacterium ADurb.Bin419]|nr:MAG: heat shock protein 90 [Firmicutes bacterium ADurb.Bin419]